MQIKKIKTDIIKFQREIAIPITSSEVMSSKAIQEEAVISDIRNTEQWVLLELSVQYLYSKLFGENCPICRMLYLSDHDLLRSKSFIEQCFRKKTYYKIKTPLLSYPITQIKVNGITEYGINTVRNIPRNNFFNTLLHDLYIDNSNEPATDEQGLYECTQEGAKSDNTIDDSVRQLFSNRFFNSIDVSGMSISELLHHETINQIVEQKSCSFLFIENFSGTKQIKTLCWK